MEVNISGRPETLDGEPFTNTKGEPLAFKAILENALLGNYNDEASLGGKEKLDRWELAKRIRASNGTVGVTSEEISLLKALVAKAFVTPVSAQTWERLEGGGKAEETN
jgi:hypothetical protein